MTTLSVGIREVSERPGLIDRGTRKVLRESSSTLGASTLRVFLRWVLSMSLLAGCLLPSIRHRDSPSHFEAGILKKPDTSSSAS